MERFSKYILVVEDDKQIRNFICYTLKSEDFKYMTSGTGKGALGLLVSEQIDLLLLDLGLPDIDGMDVIKKVREWSEIPIIVVSAHDQTKDIVAALSAGADDYLTKPFSSSELIARIRVAFRHLFRYSSIQEQTEAAIGGLKIDLSKRSVVLDGADLHLTPMEYQLLAYMFRNIGKVLTTESIILEIWGIGYGTDTQALRTLMAGLRRKIENNPTKPRYIMTEIGVGYRLAEE
jgi:two-component system, OmpR family, KDP operon response regulator KdpE